MDGEKSRQFLLDSTDNNSRKARAKRTGEKEREVVRPRSEFMSCSKRTPKTTLANPFQPGFLAWLLIGALGKAGIGFDTCTYPGREGKGRGEGRGEGRRRV